MQRNYADRPVFDPASGMEWPALLLKESALRHNAEVMARYCAERDVSLAPHGKTHASPELWRLQQDAGAWGVSVASGRPVPAGGMAR